MSGNNLLEDKQEIMKMRIYCERGKKIYYVEFDKNDTVGSVMDKFLKQRGYHKDCAYKLKYYNSNINREDFSNLVIKYYEYGHMFQVTICYKVLLH